MQKKNIDTIYKSLVGGKTSFGDAAVKHSDCSSGEQGGSLGEFGKGMMVKSFEDVAFSLEINEISEPFESRVWLSYCKKRRINSIITVVCKAWLSNIFKDFLIGEKIYIFLFF